MPSVGPQGWVKIDCECDDGYISLAAWLLATIPLAWSAEPAGNVHEREGITDVGWRKSSYSDAGTCMSCVEVEIGDSSVLVRHSADPHGPTVTCSLDEWATFIAGVKAGEFDIAARMAHLNRSGSP